MSPLAYLGQFWVEEIFMTEESNLIDQNKIIDSASTLMIANTLFVVTGFASKIIVAGIFGAGIALDA